MSNTKKAYLQLHFAVLLYGLTAILGDLISLSAFYIVWWRVLLTSGSLILFFKILPEIKKLPVKTVASLFGIGVLIALHWLCFYGSIKLANASIGLICMATTSLFTSLFEPFIFRRKIDPIEVVFGLLIIPAMAIIIWNIPSGYFWGTLVGLLAALLAALFNTLNKKFVDVTDSYTFTFIELFSAFLFLTLVLPAMIQLQPDTPIMPKGATDWFYLSILAFLCTTLAFILSLRALKVLSAYAVNLVINLEPLYGILLAAVVLHEYEELNTTFYVGGAILLIIVFSYPFVIKKTVKNDS